MVEKEKFKNVPEYYPWMYLDGYSPEEILYSARQTMLKNSVDDDHNFEVEIMSMVNKL